MSGTYDASGAAAAAAAASQPTSANLTVIAALANAVGALTNDGAGGFAYVPSAGSGTVTSVNAALPVSTFSASSGAITASGTITFTFIAQPANKVFAGPATGADATPTWRVLVAADIPSLTLAKISDAGTAASHAATDFDVAGAAAAITLSGLGGVPTSRTVAGHALTANVTITAADVGADVAGAAAAVTTTSIGAVPVTRTINGLDLSANRVLTASDVGADASGLAAAAQAASLPLHATADSATTAAACSGNAATATKLATPRAINGVNFDGSAPITVQPPYARLFMMMGA